MKNTNEIEKQLARKADAYIAQKAEEMYTIHKEIAEFVGGGTNFIDYITHFNQYNEASPEDKSKYVTFAEHGATKKKYKLELELNYKRRLVAKYTKELLTKLDIFE